MASGTNATASIVSGLVSMFGTSGSLALLAQGDLGSVDKMAAMGFMGVVTSVSIGLWVRAEWLRDRDAKAATATLIAVNQAHEARYQQLMADQKSERQDTQKSMVSILLQGFEKLTARMDANTAEMRENTNALKAQTNTKDMMSEVTKLIERMGHQ